MSDGTIRWIVDFIFNGTRFDEGSPIGLFDPLPWSRKARQRRRRRARR
jgi:hypothetical protein